LEMRIPIFNREASAYIKLRRLGYSISVIARVFRRSASVVYRRIRKALERGILTWKDLRKIPNHVRRISRTMQWTRMISWLPRWEQWILGEGEKPP